MTSRMLGGVLYLLCLSLVGGCASTPHSRRAVKVVSGSGEVSGALRTIELHIKRPELETAYITLGRERLFASDREVFVWLEWALPGPGFYLLTVSLRTPAGDIHRRSEEHFYAPAANSSTVHPFLLPQGEEARTLAGVWRVEVTLDGTPVGHRSFTFDPSSIRLRTEARVVLLQGTDDAEEGAGGWIWKDRFGALQMVKDAHAKLGIALRDELARRFPHVDGPRQSPADPDATLLVRTNYRVSPNPDTGSRLTVNVVHVPTQTIRTYLFQVSAQLEESDTTGRQYFYIEAADLAFQAAANSELLQFLITASQAVPE